MDRGEERSKGEEQRPKRKRAAVKGERARRRKRRGVRPNPRFLAFANHPFPPTGRTQGRIGVHSRIDIVTNARAASRQKESLHFENQQTKEKKNRRRQKSLPSPNLSYLDTVPVILSPLCGAKVVASRSSSNFL